MFNYHDYRGPCPKPRLPKIDYRKKPVVIHAIQWDGTITGARSICAKFSELITLATDIDENNGVRYWAIGTLEGGHEVSKGDWIIKGVKGEFYPCKPEIFELTYEKVV